MLKQKLFGINATWSTMSEVSRRLDIAFESAPQWPLSKSKDGWLVKLAEGFDIMYGKMLESTDLDWLV